MGTGGAAAADLYMEQARAYLSHSGVRPGEHSDVVWSFRDGALLATDTPAAVYHLELAKKAAHRALTAAPESPPQASRIVQQTPSRFSKTEEFQNRITRRPLRSR